MSVLVTGAAGMLGQDVCRSLESSGREFRAADRTVLDVTDTAGCRALLLAERPRVVIHCAAWTAVDAAEADPEGAYRLNALGALNVAAACAEVDAWMVYVSTDFVFDGDKGSAYDEFDAVNPLSVYGRSKEAGERLVRTTLPDRHMIARTAFVFGPGGPNIVRTIANAARTRPSLTFVADQVVSPTHTADLARTVIRLADDPLPGTYHVASAGACSLAELARHTVATLGLSTPVLDTTYDEYVARVNPPAHRPRRTPLLRRMLRMRGMDDLPDWRDAVAAYLAREG